MFVGRDLDRVDALDKVRGTAEFAHDLKMEGMLFACVVRSTRAHALLTEIDVSEALAVPGVLRVVSYRRYSWSEYLRGAAQGPALSRIRAGQARGRADTPRHRRE